MTERDTKGRFLKPAKADDDGEDFLQRPPSTKLVILLLVVLIFLLWFPHEKGRRMLCTYLCKHEDFDGDLGPRAPPFNPSSENGKKLTPDVEDKTLKKPEK